VLRPVDRFVLVLMGLAWLLYMYMIVIETYYRHTVTLGITRRARPTERESRLAAGLRGTGLHILAKRFAQMTSIPPIAAGLAYLVQKAIVLLVTRQARSGRAKAGLF